MEGQSPDRTQKPNPKPRSFVSERLLKGLTDEEIKQFENSYLRSKKVLKVINAYALKQAEEKLKTIDSPASLNAPNWDKLMAWASGYRYAMRIMQELTRT